MSRKIKVATFSIMPRSYLTMPKDRSPIDCMIESLEKNLAQVLPDHPDLIVLPECCDRPSDMKLDEARWYYDTRRDEVLEFIRRTAAENRCYIAFGAVRDMPDGSRRNSCYMIGREGEIVGIYDKNYIVVDETTKYGILPEETLIKSPLRGRKSENREIFDIFQDFCIFKGSILLMKGDICPIWA